MHIRSGGAALDSASTRVVIGAAALLAISFGTAYALPVFFPVVISKLGIPSWHLTALFSATGALYFSLGLMVGPVADRKGTQRIAMLGQFVLAAGLMLAGSARSEFTFDITYLLGVGLGVGLCFVPAMAAVQVVCQRSPALAGGFAATGIGVGTLVEPPLVQGIIDDLGWREALQVMSAVAVCGMFAARLLPRGTSVNRDRLPTCSRCLPRLGAASRGSRFALLYTAQVFVSMVAFVPFAHLVLFAQTKGCSAGTGVALIGLTGLGSLCGRCLLGYIAQSLGCCRSAAVCTVIMAVALTGLILFSDSWELRFDAVLYGLGYGGVVGLLAPAVAEVSGVAGIGRSLGWVATSRAVGILVGPWAVGAMAFWLGSYDLPFLGCALLAMAAALLFYRLHCRLPAPTGENASLGAIDRADRNPFARIRGRRQSRNRIM